MYMISRKELPLSDSCLVSSEGSYERTNFVSSEEEREGSKNFDVCVNRFDKDGYNHTIGIVGMELIGDSSISDLNQINPQESKQLSSSCCEQSLLHACQCWDANCCVSGCRKMKSVLQHANCCKQRTRGGCRICKHLNVLCWNHGEFCQDAKCAVPYCLSIRLKQRLSIVNVQNRFRSSSVPLSSPVNCSTINRSPSSPRPPTLGVDIIKSMSVFQALLQERAATSRQIAPHKFTPAVNYGEGNPVVSSPTPSPDMIVTHCYQFASTNYPPRHYQPRKTGLRSQSEHMGPSEVPYVSQIAPYKAAVNYGKGSPIANPSPNFTVTQCMPGIKNVAWASNWGENSNFSQNPLSHHSPRPQPMRLRPQSQLIRPSGMSYSAVTTIGSLQGMQTHQQPNQPPRPQLLVYAQPPMKPMLMSFGHQQRFQNDSSQFQQIQAPVSFPSHQPLLQQPLSLPPTLEHAAQPIASSGTQANTPAQTQFPHPSLSAMSSGLFGPDQLATTSDQGSVQTEGNVFSFASEKSTRVNSRNKEMEIEGDKNSIQKQETIGDAEQSSEPIGQDIKYKEPTEDVFSVNCLLKEQTVSQENASPTPVPRVGENDVDTQPDSCSESTQPPKHEPGKKTIEYHKLCPSWLEARSLLECYLKKSKEDLAINDKDCRSVDADSVSYYGNEEADEDEGSVLLTDEEEVLSTDEEENTAWKVKIPIQERASMVRTPSLPLNVAEKKPFVINNHLSSKSNLSPNNAHISLFPNSVTPPALNPAIPQQKLMLIKAQVSGVTIDECQAAYQEHGGNVEAAIKSLQLLQLCHLGVASKTQCENALKSVNWDVELAASNLVDGLENAQ